VGLGLNPRPATWRFCPRALRRLLSLATPRNRASPASLHSIETLGALMSIPACTLSDHHPCVMEVAVRLRLRGPLLRTEVRESIDGDAGVRDSQHLTVLQREKVNQTSVGDLGVVKVKSFKLGQAGQSREAYI
jgi:hypothetical protein